jgi:hypothetical protein
MSIDDAFKDAGDESSFSFGVTELNLAKLDRSRTKTVAGPGAAQGARSRTVQFKPVNNNIGFDPYNSTGSFDRSKSWARVGKR